MAVTEIYVDPSIAADSGAGTVGDPYGDLEYAIEQETFDTTNGTRVNIKAGTDEVLAVELSAALADTVTSVAWAPSETAPCIFQGYTSAAGDGGIGGISGGGSVAIMTTGAFDFISFIDLHLHNTASGTAAITADNYINVIGCELNNLPHDAIDCDAFAYIADNYLHDVGRYGVALTNQGNVVVRNHFEDGTKKFSRGLSLSGDGTTVERNVFSLSGAAVGILVDSAAIITNNAIYCAAGTGTGISLSAVAAAQVTNNLVEGFSGIGGVGIGFASSAGVVAYGGNGVYDCATEYGTPHFIVNDLGDNETLTVSPFTSASTGDFSPVDTGNVKEGALPQIIGGGLVP